MIYNFKINSINEIAFEFKDPFNFDFFNNDIYLPPHNKYIDDIKKFIKKLKMPYR